MKTIASLIAGVALLAANPVLAQIYPAKPIRIVVPFAPGGSTDILSRTIAQKMTDAWKQQVLVDNRAGANGIVGADIVAKSPPDGYTLVMATNGTHGINASLYPKLPYDTVKDFAPISRLGQSPYLLVAHPSLPVRTVKDLIQLARGRPGEITFSSGGSVSQLAAELFKKTARINLIVVPYK